MKHIRRRASVLIAGLALVATTAACSSSGGGTDSTAGATGGSAAGGSAAGGGGTHKLKSSGTIGVIISDGSSESLQHWAGTVKTALKAIGWKEEFTDGKGDPTVWGQAITSYTTQHVDGIITMAIDAAPVTQQLAAAKAAGIPVIASGITVDPSGQSLFAGHYSPSDKEFGQITAAYLKTKFPTGSQYVDLDLSAVYGAHEPIVVANPILKAAGFKLVGTHDISTAGIIQSATQGSVNLITAHPQAKFMFGCCDFTPDVSVPALKQAGFTNVLQTARYDNLSVLALIRAGDPVAIAACNADTGILISVDQILRKASGQSIQPDAANGVFKYKMIDKSNLPAAGKYYYDPAAQIATFTAKWKSEYGL